MIMDIFCAMHGRAINEAEIIIIYNFCTINIQKYKGNMNNGLMYYIKKKYIEKEGERKKNIYFTLIER